MDFTNRIPGLGDDEQPGRTDPAADEPEVEVLVEDIEQTREEMTVTVEAIGDRLDPGNIVQDAKQTVRDATVGKVETMANEATQAVEEVGRTAQQASSGIVDTIRRNPVPAALVGLGLTWLWMNRTTTSDGSRNDRGYGSGVGGGYRGGYGMSGWDPGVTGRAGLAASRSGAEGRGGGVGEMAGRIGERGQHIAEDVAHQAQQSVGEVAGQAQETVGQVADQAQHTARQVQRGAERAMQDNPLALGAAAVAVGAAIGMALPATQTERRLLGEPGRDLVQQAETKIEDSMRQMEQSSR